MCFRNGSFTELAAVSREGLSSCETAKFYKVEWSDVDSSPLHLLTFSQFETEKRTWVRVISARYERRIPLFALAFYRSGGLKSPQIGTFTLERHTCIILKGFILQTWAQAVKESSPLLIDQHDSNLYAPQNL